MLFEKKVWLFIESQNLLVENETIVVGVSGSVDSLSLLYFLAKYAEKMKWCLIVAHVDHMFRGEESQKDYEFVEEHCKKLGLTFEGTHINVSELILQKGKNGQQVSRECRYTFFQEIMHKYQAQKLALAHHLDDQTETMLMNLTREVSRPGKLGIPVTRSIKGGKVVRPFLCVTKKEIETRCDEFSLIPRVDSSNAKLTYTRNRFRKNIVPLLKKENPKVLEHFASFNKLLSEDDEFILELAKAEFDRLTIEKLQGSYSIDLNAFRKLKTSLQRRVLPLILTSLTCLKPFSISNVNIGLILTLIEDSRPSITIQVDENFHIIKSFERLLFCFEPTIFSSYEESLLVPGETVLLNGDVILTELITGFNNVEDLNEFHIPVELLPLKIRNKVDGDKIALPNLSGRKKLKKVLLEHKVPIFLRNNWPVVLTDRLSEEIIWMPNLVKARLPNVEKQGDIFVKLTFLTSTYLGGFKNGNS